MLAVGSDDRSITTTSNFVQTPIPAPSSAAPGSTAGKVFIYEYNDIARRCRLIDTKLFHGVKGMVLFLGGRGWRPFPP
jgi:hypothetical protein